MLIDIKDKLQLLPETPGCYMHIDKTGKVIYVGKAKNLKRRVSSYFRGAHNLKTTKLISEIDHFNYLVTDTEKESLILEINLIKKYNPKYNIALKGDNYYPYIMLTQEKNPRLLLARNIKKVKRKGKYYGPYPNSTSARKTVNLLNTLYPLRKCSSLPKKECLYYHMHQCLAPCINRTENFDYSSYVHDIDRFLKGDNTLVLKLLEEKMMESASNWQYESAAEYRDLISDVKLTTSHQKINSSDFVSKDIFGFHYDKDFISCTVLYVRNGNIVQNYNTIFDYTLDVNDAIENFIINFYPERELLPKEIIVNDYINTEIIKDVFNVNVLIPKRGNKVKLLEMANKNAKKDLVNKKLLHKNKVLRKIETVEKLGETLGIEPPRYIEAFDNSNLFGEFPVSGMVVFRDGRPSKSEYRKYKVKTVKGANDYATMKEVIYRRYLRLIMEAKELPDLIVMDGGEIQVNAAIETLNMLNAEIAVCGVKKDENHKARILVFDNKEIPLNRNSDVFLLLSNISETVHQYAINFFRSKKIKGMYKSKLDGISGLGPKGKEKLLKKFVTIDKIRTSSVNDLKAAGITEKAAINVLEHLNKDDENESNGTNK